MQERPNPSAAGKRASAKSSRQVPNGGKGQPKEAVPLTVSRPELLVDGSDRAFRRLVHALFAFMARHDAVRDGHASRIGLAGIEYTVLISISHLGRDTPVNIKTVADHLRVSGAFVTAVTRKLQALGLVDKVTDQVDRRRTFLHLTEKARTELERLAPHQREVNDVEFGCLSHAEFLSLLDMVERLITAGDRAVALNAHRVSTSTGVDQVVRARAGSGAAPRDGLPGRLIRSGSVRRGPAVRN